ncbi:MAG: DUF4143 domain-containing protein, partial [Bacteroidaceae bacterium]|nr:DUF4143 domain-containing protein [Bacteroidaceae bacterium]
MEYKQRVADTLLVNKLRGTGAVLIEGAKWCGKTTTAEQLAKSVIYLDNPKDRFGNLQMAQINPSMLLNGETPRLIDEWQLAPELWDAVRFEVDHRGKDGQFILTGSVTPISGEDEQKIHHSGAGRITRLRMRPMTLWESGDSNGQVSLGDIFANKNNIVGSCDKELSDIAWLICRGGWPRAIDQDKETALGRAFDYFDTVVHVDIKQPDRIERNPERVKLLMRSYARNQGTPVSLTALCADMKANDSDTLDDRTVYSYLNALKSIFVVEDCKAWNPNIRSKAAIRTSDTRYFTDPSIAVASMGIGPDDLLSDLNTMGLFFETLCMRDLRVYAQVLDGDVYHYRDSDGLECDAVVHLRNGAYGLIEIKLGGENAIEEGARTLLKLGKKLDTDKMKSPSFFMVLTAVGSYAYQREDGVYVVPIGCLK